MDTQDKLLDKDGKNINVDENELYRMAYLDEIIKWDFTEYQEYNSDEVISDVEKIGKEALQQFYETGFLSFVPIEYVPITNNHLLEHIDEYLDKLINNTIYCWLKNSQNDSPIYVIYEILFESLWLGFTKNTGIERTDDDDFENFLWIDSEVLLDCFCREYVLNKFPINATTIKSIVRQATRMLFSIGYSFGNKYRKENPKKFEMELFSEEEMKGGIKTDFFEIYEDAYLESMRIISKLEDSEFYILSEEYRQHVEENKEVYYFRSIPERAIYKHMFYALGEMINLRHFYNNHLYSFEKAKITIPFSYKSAKERFMLKYKKENYVKTDWVTSYNHDS